MEQVKKTQDPDRKKENSGKGDLAVRERDDLARGGGEKGGGLDSISKGERALIQASFRNAVSQGSSDSAEKRLALIRGSRQTD